jgi:hypothetical protein
MCGAGCPQVHHLEEDIIMDTFVADLATTVAPAGTVHSVAAPQIPVYVIIMLIVRSLDQMYFD